jgi:hypothetical protein
MTTPRAISICSSSRVAVDAAEENAMQKTAWHVGLEHCLAVQLVVRSHQQWWNGIDQAMPLRLQIDADGSEVYSR